LPEDSTQEDGAQLVAYKRQSFSGPIPPPHILAEYENILPGAADRILAMSEKQSNHRQNLEMQEETGQRRETRIGQFLGFGIAVAVISASVIYVMLVPSSPGLLTGGTLSGGTIIGLVYAFRYSRKVSGDSPTKPDDSLSE